MITKMYFLHFYIELTRRIYVPSFITDILSAVQIIAFFPFSNLVFLSFLNPFVSLALNDCPVLISIQESIPFLINTKSISF